MRLLWTFVPLLSWFLIVTGYKIDADCGSDREFVRQGIESAFEMARTAIPELETDILDPRIEDVFKQLFGKGIKERGALNIVEIKLKNLRHIEKLDEPVAKGVTDVTFYCSTARIGKRSDGVYYNKDKKWAYPSHVITNKWADCFKTDPDRVTLAMTTNIASDLFAEIQICPWFMVTMREWKMRDWTDINKLTMGLYAKWKLPKEAREKYTPIDSFSLFDKVMLHEMMHIRQLKQAPAVDMDEDPGPYGWKNCKGLAQNYVDSKFLTNLDPQQNADSIALLGSAIKLIKAGVRISENGDLDPPQQSKKRNVPMYPVTWSA